MRNMVFKRQNILKLLELENCCTEVESLPPPLVVGVCSLLPQVRGEVLTI